jgi:alkylated DNA repair dioxygenase AlkB
MSATGNNLDLFENTAPVPDGFIYRENFLSETEEQELIRKIQCVVLSAFRYYQFTGKRRTVSFGWQYEFGRSAIATAPEMPEFLFPLRRRAGEVFAIDPAALVQASIIEYSVGSPIGWHRDVPYFGMIVGISLGSACRMRFRKSERTSSKRSKRAENLSIDLKPRSIYFMSRASRETWQHSIPPVKELRYAIMMRTLRSKTSR